jgi:hypothetical protein
MLGIHRCTLNRILEHTGELTWLASLSSLRAP